MDSVSAKESRSAIVQGFELLWPAALFARGPYWILKWWPSTAPALRLLLPIAVTLGACACVGFAIKRRGIDAVRFGLIAIGAAIGGVWLPPSI